jgi:hypothetical protein
LLIEYHRRGEYARRDIKLQELLLNADLRIIIEARCRLLLATTDDGEVDFVGQDCEAVTILDQASERERGI